VSTDPTGGPDHVAAMRDQVDQRINQVGRNSANLAVGTLVSRVLGFAKLELLSLCVATALTGDAFNIANTLPNQIYILLSTGLITAVLIPQITRAYAMKDGGEDFVNRLLTLVWLVLIGVTVAATALTPVLIRLLTATSAAHHAPAMIPLAILFGYWCMPQLFFYGMYAVLGQVLNARGHFRAYAWAPVWANVVNIAAFVAFYLMWHQRADPAGWTWQMIAVLAGGSTLSIVVQGACLIVPLLRDGFHYRPTFGWRGYGFRTASRMSGWMLAVAAITTLYSFVQTWALTAARGGANNAAGNSVQAYAFQLFMVPHSIVTTSIVTAMFPRLSKAWADRNTGAVRSQIRQGMTSSALIIIPASIAMIALGFPLIRTLIAGLSDAQVTQVWLVMSAYCIGMFPFGINSLRQNYFMARQDGATNFWQVVVTIVVQALSVVVALTAVSTTYRVGTMALGQTVSAVVGAVIFLWLARRQLGSIALRAQGWLWTRLFAASVIAGIAGLGVVWSMGHASQAHLFQPVVLVVGCIVFCLVFWVVALVLRIGEFTDLVHGLLKRVRRA